MVCFYYLTNSIGWCHFFQYQLEITFHEEGSPFKLLHDFGGTAISLSASSLVVCFFASSSFIKAHCGALLVKAGRPELSVLHHLH
jgi:hypothetical protein